MATEIKATQTVKINGETFTEEKTIDYSVVNEFDLTFNAAKTGTVVNGTTITLAGGHGLVSTDSVMIFWDGGVAFESSIVISSNTMTVTPDFGTLPAASTAVTVCKKTTVTLLDSFTLPTDVLFVGARNNTKGRLAVIFRDSTNSAIFPNEEVSSSEARFYDIPAGKSVGLVGGFPSVGNVMSTVYATPFEFDHADVYFSETSFTAKETALACAAW